MIEGNITFSGVFGFIGFLWVCIVSITNIAYLIHKYIEFISGLQ